jgi:hypothetical protein
VSFYEDDGCPVCGTSHANCRSRDNNDVRIIGADIFPSLGYEDMWRVEEDVYVDRAVAHANFEAEDGGLLQQLVSARVRVAKKGDIITMTEARRLGIAT